MPRDDAVPVPRQRTGNKDAASTTMSHGESSGETDGREGEVEGLSRNRSCDILTSRGEGHASAVTTAVSGSEERMTERGSGSASTRAYT